MVVGMRPIVGITMGDPAGIGPEICIKTLMEQKLYDNCRPLLVGDATCIERTLAQMGCTDFAVRCVSSVEDAWFRYGVLDVYHLSLLEPGYELGKVSVCCGAAAFQAVHTVIQLALQGVVDATVTAPINKEAINLAGYHFAGHTEIYAHYTDTLNYTMMLAHQNLRVVHVSTHVSLAEACRKVTRERVLTVIRLAHQACCALGIADPVVGVAGLNPHSGENGMFGKEELEEIFPAIVEANKGGIHACGPVPPDTVFAKALGGSYNVVVAMYHDQGHIPVKLVGFTYGKGNPSINGVNITLGLPIIRVSVDHGTAYDIAGKGVATNESLTQAVEYAIQLARNRHGGCIA